MKEARLLAQTFASRLAVVGDQALPNARTKIDFPFLEYYSFRNDWIAEVVFPKVVERQKEASLHSLLTSKGPFLQVQVPNINVLYILFDEYFGTPIYATVFSGGHQEFTESKLTAAITSILSLLSVTILVSSRDYQGIQGENIAPPHQFKAEFAFLKKFRSF